MKHVKRFLSVLLVLALTMSFSTAVFAASTAADAEDGYVYIKDAAGKNSTYKAYQLLTIAGSDKTEDGQTVYQYQVHRYYREALKAVTGKDNDADIIEYLQALEGNATPYDADHGTTVRRFADAMFKYLVGQKDGQQPQVTVKNNGAEEVIFKLEPGYYLFREETSAEDEGTITSLVMLQTVGAGETLHLNAKEEAPSLIKKVHDVNDTEGEQFNKPDDKYSDAYWQDSADHDFDDAVEYKLEATLGDIAPYDRYYMAFYDDMCAGLTYQEITSVYLQHGTERKPIPAAADGGAGYTAQLAASSDVYTGGHRLTVEISDLLEAVGYEEGLSPAEDKPQKGDKVVVLYTAVLNSGAVIGTEGNPNVVYLEYSNNPYNTGKGDNDHGDTGHTPKDFCIVFTYQADVDKVDGNKKPLEGAGFTVYKQVPDKPTDDVQHEILTTETGKETYWRNVGEMELKANETTKFVLKGLDDGTYMLRETTVPEGYYPIEDIFFTITATHEGDSEHPELPDKLTGFAVQVLKDGTWVPGGEEFTATLTTGIISTTIMNVTGARLPSTGGIGTTVFYVAGGVLVLGAAVLLVLKKRNGAGK